MDYDDVCSKINGLHSTFDLLNSKGFRCIKNKKYDFDAWMDAYFFDNPGDTVDVSFVKWLEVNDVAYIEVQQLLKIDGIEDHAFIIDGFDIPKDYFGYPTYYREHFMYYAYGTLFDDDWGSYDDGTFYVKRIHTIAPCVALLKYLITDLCDKVYDVSYAELIDDAWESRNNHFVHRGWL